MPFSNLFLVIAHETYKKKILFLSESPMKLSSDDLQMLERWKNMQNSKSKPDSKLAKPGNSTVSIAPKQVEVPSFIAQQNPVQVTLPSQQPGNSQPSLNLASMSQTTGGIPQQPFLPHAPTAVLSVQGMSGASTVTNIVDNSLTNQQQPSTLQTVFNQPNIPTFPKQETTTGITAKQPPSYNEAISQQTGYFSLPQNGVVNVQQAEKTATFQQQPLPPFNLSQKEGFISYPQAEKHLSPSDLLYGGGDGGVASSQVPQSLLPPEAFLNTTNTNPNLNPEPTLPQQAAGPSLLKSADPALPVFQTTSPASTSSLTSSLTGGATANPPSSEIPSDFLNFINKMSKTKSDDLTLMNTPKGSGAGYGVGLDLDSILAEGQPQLETRFVLLYKISTAIYNHTSNLALSNNLHQLFTFH